MQRGSAVALWLVVLAGCSGGAARTPKPNPEPTEDPARVAAGLRAWHAGDVKTAIAELEAAHARDPRALAVLARAWLQAGDAGKARAVGATALAAVEGSGTRATLRLVADLGEGVERVAANGDGTLVATSTPARAGKKPATTIWDTTIGRDLYRLADTQVAAFGGDGVLVTGGADGVVAVREAATGKVVRELAPKIGAVVWIGIAPDNAIIAVDATSIHEWDAASGSELRAYSAPKRFRADKSAFAVSPDGAMLVGALRTGEAAGDICAIWSRRDPAPRPTIIKLRKWVVGGLAIARDGRIAIGVRARPLAKIVFVDRNRAAIAGEIDVAADVRVLGYAANGDLVAAGKTLQRFHSGVAKPIHDVALAHEVGRGRGAFVADAGVLIAVHDSIASIATTGDAAGKTWASAGRAEAVHALAWSPDGTHLAIGGASTQVTVWDVARGGRPKTYDAGEPVSAIAIDRDGRVAASLHHAKSHVIVWNAAGAREHEIEAHELGSLSFDGAGGLAGRELDDPHVVHAWNASGAAITPGVVVSGRTFAVSPDGTRVAEASRDRIVIRDASGKVVGVVRVDNEPTAVAWGAHALATAHPDGRIACYNHDTGETVRTLTEAGGAGVVTQLAFRPDGRTLAVARLDGVVDLWDMPSQTRIAQLVPGSGDRWLVIGADGSVDGEPGATSMLTWEAAGVALPWIAAWDRHAKPQLLAAVVATPPPALAIAPMKARIEPPPSCLPAGDIGPPLVSAIASGDGATASACWLRETDHHALCFDVELASGRITPVAPDLETQATAGRWGHAEPTAPPVTWDDDHAEAKVCSSNGSTCRTFRGTDVAVTGDHELVAVRTDAQHVEIWELASNKRIARHAIAQKADAHSTIGFWSRTLLVSAETCDGPCETSVAYDTRTGRRLGHVGSKEHPANTSEFAPVLLHDDVWAFHEDHTGGAIVIQDASTAKLIGRVAAKELGVDPKELRGPTYELRAARDGGVVIAGSGKLAGRVWTLDRKAAVSHAWRVPACTAN